MKKTIKKSLSLLLVCLLVISVTAIMVAAETVAVDLTTGSVSGAAGDTVTVPVSIAANSGVASGSFAIDFNSSYLTLTDVESNADGMVALGNCQVGVTADNANQIGVAFIGDSLTEPVDANGGVLFNLVFKISQNVPTTTTALTFNFTNVRETDNMGLFDVDKNAVEVNAINGEVSISGTSEYSPAQVTLGAASATPGETVSVPVNISANSYVVSGAFCVEYDSNVLEYTGYTDGALNGVTQLSVGGVADGSNAVGIIFSTENPTTSSITEGGTIATLSFKIKDGASTGTTTPLTFSLVRPDDALVQGGVATVDALDEDATFTGCNVTIETPITTSDVVFNVTPATATVTMNGNSVTAVGGVATFNDVDFGTYNYTVSADGYTDKTGSVDVVANTSPVTVSLDQITTSDVTFNVTPATATVTMNGNSVTAVGGVATFNDVDFGTYNYTVSANGYTDKTGSVDVVANTSPVTVSLDQITTSDVTFNVTPATATVTMNG
ncbi:MAG: cohesin domain-containing protein, partial [Bacillota bacterium]|nr:cohesin domain-containing protein [Bacillota bacterium]